MGDKASIPNAGGDKENVPKKGNIMFVRGETQSQSVLEAEKEPTVNPDAMDLDSDDDSDEEQSDKDDEANDANEDSEPVAKKSKKMFEEQAIPSEVFGSLKKDE